MLYRSKISYIGARYHMGQRYSANHRGKEYLVSHLTTAKNNLRKSFYATTSLIRLVTMRSKPDYVEFVLL